MSVVLDRPYTRTRLPKGDGPVVRKPQVPTVPSRQPYTDTPGQVSKKVRRRSGTAVATAVVSKVALFACVFGVTYVASALSGHYLVEKSRHQSIEATSRANVAVEAEREVQRRLDVLSTSSSIEDWALSHSFRPADGLGPTSKVVNLVTSNQ